MAAGRGVGDATWRQKILADLDRRDNKAVAEILWDVSKCFEHVQADLLADTAERLGYPLDILAVSLSAYRWRRIVFYDNNIVGEPIWLDSGIVA